eukprot:s2617_g2.t1
MDLATSALDFLHLGLSLSAQGFARMGVFLFSSGVSTVRGSLSVCNSLGQARLYTTQTGGALLGDWTAERPDLSASVPDLAHFGLSPSLRGVAQLSFLLLATGLICVGSVSSPSLMEVAFLDVPLLVRSPSRSDVSPFVSDFVHSDFVSSSRQHAWMASLLPVLGRSQTDSSSSALSFTHFDSTSLSQNPARMGSVLSVSDLVTLEASSFPRSLAKVGPSMTICGMLRADFASSLPVSDVATSESFSSLRSFARPEPPSLASDLATPGSAPSPRSLARPGAALPVVGMACGSARAFWGVFAAQFCLPRPFAFRFGLCDFGVFVLPQKLCTRGVGVVNMWMAAVGDLSFGAGFGSLGLLVVHQRPLVSHPRGPHSVSATTPCWGPPHWSEVLSIQSSLSSTARKKPRFLVGKSQLDFTLSVLDMVSMDSELHRFLAVASLLPVDVW